VEGDSALTSCKLAREAEFQAIMPVRGKTLNCLKSTYDKIFSSDIIVDLLRVIGCGVELETKTKSKGKGADLSIFELSRLKWSKIIICTDADEDGFQIRVLILTMFYRLLPTLLREGRVYIAESPLFEITTKDETFFAYDEREKAAILKELDENKKKYTIQRSKGLGENEADMMSKTTMNPASRRLIRICEDDAFKTAEMFDIMLGDNPDRRKDYIARHGAEYLFQADI
ncbi:MAG: DNA topoisomerase, partial [Clostridia bacterium]|nr:DNA topoisomerase [Clostridia bacterium]